MVETIDPLDLAYLAGVIDSDGFVTILRVVRPQGVYHGCRVGITGTRPAPHDLAASIFGGSVRCYENRGHRMQFHWTRDGANAAVVLRAIRSYLRVKQQNADLALRLHDHVRGVLRSPEAVAEREAMHRLLVNHMNEGRKQIGGRTPTAGGDELDGERIKQFPESVGHV